MSGASCQDASQPLVAATPSSEPVLLQSSELLKPVPSRLSTAVPLLIWSPRLSVSSLGVLYTGSHSQPSSWLPSHRLRAAGSSTKSASRGHWPDEGGQRCPVALRVFSPPSHQASRQELQRHWPPHRHSPSQHPAWLSVPASPSPFSLLSVLHAPFCLSVLLNCRSTRPLLTSDKCPASRPLPGPQ